MLAAFPPPLVRSPDPVRSLEAGTLKGVAPLQGFISRGRTHVREAGKHKRNKQHTARQGLLAAAIAAQTRHPLHPSPKVRLACAPFRLSHKPDSGARTTQVSITSRGR